MITPTTTPGTRVIVTPWKVTLPSSRQEMTLSQLVLCPRPIITDAGLLQCNRIGAGTLATIISCLPAFETLHVGNEQKRFDWVLLLTDTGLLGWTCELIALKVI